MKQRLQKILSEYGVASRRHSEELIREGRVLVNGTPAAVGDQADPDTDRITVDGQELLPLPQRRYLMMYKPRGIVTTAKDERGRKTVLELLPPGEGRMYPIGRLDLDSEGLLLLTNDGDLCHKLTHPSHEVDKTYLVWVRGDCGKALPVLNEAMSLDGVKLRPAKTELQRGTPEGGLLRMTIHEGKNRQIRRMCQQLDLEVTRLKRIRVGQITLGGLRPGESRPLTDGEIEYLKRVGSGKR